MERIEKSIEVKCPLSTVYNQWTQFEEFPRFMAGVKEVKQLGDAPNGGTVRFEPVGTDKTRVRLAMDYEPQGIAEKVGDAVGIMTARVQNSVENFKKYIESRGAESGAWRGEVHGGRKTR